MTGMIKKAMNKKRIFRECRVHNQRSDVLWGGNEICVCTGLGPFFHIDQRMVCEDDEAMYTSRGGCGNNEW